MDVEARIETLSYQNTIFKMALDRIAGSHLTRVGYDQTDIADEPDLTSVEAMTEARTALSNHMQKGS